MVELATYRLESLRRDAEIVLSRGRRETSPCQILVVAPRSKRPSPETLKRLGREYSLRAELDSAFAVRPLALIREGEQTALILEDRGGKPLDRLLGQALDLTEFLRISINLANALGRLHERGIIHRDIKPANVIVDTASSRVWLTGFGIASDLPRQRQTPERPETIAGTLPYMSPEQTGRMNRSIDSRSDLYSLGVTLYEMLTGALPFSASDPLEWVHCHIARQPIPPGERAKNLPASVCAIIMKLLAKTAEERYQTAAGAESDLRRCLAQWETQRRIDNFPLGEHDTPDRLLIPEKLYGRGREIDTLLASFDRVVASGTPELVLVSGYSGIGKSSVVNELHKALVPSRGLFASGKFDQYKRDIPYSILAQAFQSLVRPLLGKSEAELHNWRDALLEALGANGLLMVDLVPELELIIGEQPAVPELPPQDAKARFQLVFRRFIGVFARREHPLALFLDDLQWLDAATLDLLEDLLSQPDVRHLMLIGAYRDNEVSAGHPLMRKLEAIRQTGAIVEEVILAPLTRGDLRQLIADALHCELERASSLAQVVHEKTAGNPFFAIQFISALTEEALLTFDHGDRRWSWDPNRIHDKGYTDNAVDLMVGKLSRLPPQTQKALQQLACFGNSSEITTLSIVNGKSEEELHSDLREAVRLEFIVRLEDSYRFVHDRVQEAAYSLISEERRAEAHLRIARLLTADIPPEDLIETIFEIVNQYNRGAALILDPNEKLRVAELNFLAGRKAKTQTAYAAACDYLSIGATLLDPKEWQSQYEFVFEVSLLCAECAFLCGRFDKAAGLTSYLLERASSKADKAAVYRLKTDLYIMKSAYPEAVDSALECLRLFGIYLSAHPSSEEVEREYKNVWRNLGERSIESLVDLPLMADREIQAAMRVLSVLYSPAFFVDTKLFYLSICHIVNLTLKYGVADASAHGYAYFGFILGPAFNRYAEGYRFGQLSVNLVEKHGFVPYKAKVYMTMAWVAIWTQPIATALGFIRNALSAAVELGDLTYGCYACDHTITDLLVRGDQLDEVWGESQRCLDFVQKAKSPDYVDRIITQQQFIQNMRGSTNNFSTFSNSLFDEADFEAKLPGDRAITCWYWILKLQARFISRDYEVAIAAAVNAERLLWAATGCIQLSEYHYYAALTMAALYTASAPDRQNEWREKLTAHRDQLKEWAENCSITFQDKYALVSAEIARIEGRAVDAEHLYEKAIRSAHANRFVHSEALANELAARFYAARGFEKIAHAYLRDARYCYVCWGATGKVRQLDGLYPQLREQESVPDPTSTIGGTVENLDLATVVKASQVVSREIDLGKLIETLMVTSLEHASAERGLLFLVGEQEPQVQAEAKTEGDHVCVVLENALPAVPEFAEAIVRYVFRTHESVILADASAGHSFSDDEYLRAKRLRSILCLPLIKQGILIGELYLENNQISGVFDKDRLTVLELLASQAAISLENARLYAERRKAEEALRASEERMSLAAEAANLGLWVWEIQSDDIWATEKCRSLFGFSPDERLDLQRFIDSLHPDDRKPTMEAIRRSLENRTEYEVEYRLAMPDSETRWISARGHATFDSENRAVRMMGVCIDITAAKLAELQLLQQRDELAHLSRVATIGEMATMLTHELNQPIGTIHSNAEVAEILLQKDSPELDEVRAIVSDIRRDVRRTGEFIQRMRSLLRKHEFKTERIDVKGLVEAVNELLHGALISHKAQLRIDVAPDLPLVSGDPIHLQQVLLNLILNALEAMTDCPPSERQVTVRAMKNPSLGVEVMVTDQGPGFPRWKLSRLFEPFSSTKKNGMGMGLAICQRIIQAHGGHISAENNPGRGAKLRFTLPSIRLRKEGSG